MKRNILSLQGLALGAFALVGAVDANACSVAAWTATNTTAVVGNSGSPPTISKYAGACGLLATPTVVVADNSPEGATETTYRARLYFRPQVSGGTAKVFSATTDDNGAGSEVLGLSVDGSGNLTVQLNGSTGATIPGLTTGSWYGVELAYIGGTSVTVTVRGANTFAPAPTVISSGVPTAGIGSHSLGFTTSNGATGSVGFDEFEASRSATPVGFFCQGDTNVSNDYGFDDVFGAIDEFQFAQSDGALGVLAAGHADYNEDGNVGFDDVFGVIDEFLAAQAGSPGSGCP